MKAVFLDRSTFSAEVNLVKPEGIEDYQVFDSTMQDDDFIVERCKNADIIITNKVVLNYPVLEKLPELKLVQVTATGMNNIDLSLCEKLGITIQNIAGYAVKSVPEHTFMLMLNAMRAGRHYHKSVINFDNTEKTSWIELGKFCLMDETIYDLEGKTLGIIGAGTIGRRVAEIAKVFGMNVLIAERQGNSPRSPEYTDFETVLIESDVLTLHCPLTKETKYLINNETISKMSKNPLIVNVARGALVDSKAMVKAVKAGVVFGYASDVFEVEPMIAEDPLREIANHPRVFYTPHNAWGSLSAQVKLWEILCKQVTDFITSSLT